MSYNPSQLLARRDKLTSWSLAFAPKGKTFVVNMDTTEVIILGDTQKARRAEKTDEVESPSKIIAIRALDPRITFVDEILRPGDHLYTLLGGSNAGFVQRAFYKGVIVFRVPFHNLEGYLTIPEVKIETPESEHEAKILGFEDKRRATALALASLAQADPEVFYPYRPCDAEIAEISIAVRMSLFLQKDRIKIQQHIHAINSDLAYLGDHSQNRKLLALRERFANQDLLRESIGIEEGLKKAVESALGGMDLYQAVFKPMKGCGPSIAGQIIDVVQDIRRFPSRNKFRKYSGWFPDGPEGLIIHRQRGQTMGISTRAKQAFYGFGDQVSIWGSGPEWIRKIFEFTKLDKIAAKRTKMHSFNQARRKSIGKFVDYVFYHWWLFEVTGGTMTHLTVPESEIPYKVKEDLADRFPFLGIVSDRMRRREQAG